MPSATECLRAIEEAAGGDLTDDEILALLEELDRIRTERRAEAKLEGVEAEMFDAAKNLIVDAKLAARIEKRNRLKNIVIRGRLLRMAKEARDQFGDASLGLEAAMVGINSRLDGGRLSADARGKAITFGWLGGMIADMRKQNLHGVYARGQHDRDIARELWDISLKNPTGNATRNKEAKKIAAIIHKYRRAAVQRENRAGAFIRFREGYITRQTHDRARMERGGFQAWSDEVKGRLDWEAMGVPRADRDKFLKSSYEALTTGVRKSVRAGDESDLLFAFTGPGNLAKKASADRVLLFKSADDWFDYNERFGIRDIREAINEDFRRAGMNSAIMDTLGTNPRAMIERVQRELQEEFRGDIKQVDRLRRPSLNWFMDELDGTVNHSNNHTLAAIGRSTRAIQSMAKLGGAFISAFADLAATASERRFQGRNLMDAWGDAFASARAAIPSGDQRRLGELLGVGIDGMLGDFTARFSAQDDVAGRISKGMRIFFKLNLLGPWTDGIKRGVGIMMGRDLGMWADNAFDALPDQVRRNLSQYGMNAKKWEVARQAVQEGPDGKRYMFPSMVEDLNVSRAQKDEVREILFSYITDRVEAASPTPGARERAFLRVGAQPGTYWGEAIRFMMQFKAFPVTVLTRVVGRDALSPGNKSIRDAFLKGEGDLVGFANFLAGATVLGYFSLQAKELAKGRDFRENNMSTLIASTLQGGALGIYGDFLLGETNRFGNSMLDTIAGPTIGTLSDIDKIRAKAMAGEDVWASMINLVKSNAPGANLFYTKAALDYMVFYQLQEMANPGYLRRMERRVARENNQRFFIPPTRAIPRGGGSRVLEGVR